MAFKDKETGKWVAQWYEPNVYGVNKQKKKRGFKTQREAKQYECDRNLKKQGNLQMSMKVFVEQYFQDKENELKSRTKQNKRYMIDSYLIPYFGDMKMSDIKPAQIIAWQNEIYKKNLSESYMRMIQNQLTALFTHATKIYDLANNPCKKVKRMGKDDKRSLTFWTVDEYKKFISTVDKSDRYYIMFEILFWTGIREGDDDDKIRLNQRKPSKYKGLSRFGPEKNLQRINKFMKERPTFYKKLIQMKENFRFYLRCFYCITKVVILQFNSEKQDRISS